MNKIILIGMAAFALSACGPSAVFEVTGATGATGAAGSSCSVSSISPNGIAPNGGSMIACQDGTSSLVLNGTNGINGSNGLNGQNGVNGADGTNGTNGINGTNGTNGINGSNGSNGTVVTAIQFCSGTGSYPSTFPEIGFCINGSIYAVYSANGGFLTEVLPGTWSSDGINSSCTFTVAPNCVVTR